MTTMTKKLSIVTVAFRFPYPLYISGADVFNFKVAKALLQKGHDIQLLYAFSDALKDGVIHDFKRLDIAYEEHDKGFEFVYDSVRVRLYHEAAFYEQVRAFSKDPDSILWYQQPILEGFDFESLYLPNSKHFVYIRSADELRFFEPVKKSAALIFANSRFCQAKIKSQYQRDAELIFPLPTTECIAKTKEPVADYISFFNPNPVKGIDIVEALIKRNTHRKFIIVYAWHSSLPDRFKAYPNLAILPPLEDISQVYALSRLVLLPAQWEEFFGRIQFEAAWNNIPVCISDRGAAAEFFSGNGVLVTDYSNVDAWQEAIDYLDDSQHYNKAVLACDGLKKGFSFDEQVCQLEKALLKAFKKDA